MIGSIYVCLHVLYLHCISKRSIVKATAAHVRKVVAGGSKTKASIQSGICKQTAVGRVEADEWRLRLVRRQRRVEYVVKVRAWFTFFAEATLKQQLCLRDFILVFFGLVCFYLFICFFFFWISTRETLRTLRFTIGSFHREHFKCVWVFGTSWRGIDTHTDKHTHESVVPGIVQEVNKKVFYFWCKWKDTKPIQLAT